MWDLGVWSFLLGGKNVTEFARGSTGLLRVQGLGFRGLGTEFARGSTGLLRVQGLGFRGLGTEFARESSNERGSRMSDDW
jgi:hypothetical protein